MCKLYRIPLKKQTAVEIWLCLKKVLVMKADSPYPVLIVGAGMAGLSCAVHLQRAGVPVRIFEASDGVGGRVRTDVVDGFLLDRGFQVYLDAYPETGALLDLEALELKAFEPGALVFDGRKLQRLMDVFRRPSSAWASATAPIGGLVDKLRVGLMRTKILGSSLEAIATREDRSTEAYLRGLGFSEAMFLLWGYFFGARPAHFEPYV